MKNKKPSVDKTKKPKKEVSAEELQKKAEVARIKAEKSEAKRRKREERESARREKLKRRSEVFSHFRKKLKNPYGGFGYRNVGFLPRVEITVKGDATEIASMLPKENISVSDLRKIDGETRFKIRKKDLRKAVAILSGMCYNFKVSGTYGAPRFLAFVIARAGLLAGAAAAILFTNIAYSYIWRVEVSGDEALIPVVESALLKNDIHSGVKKRRLDTDGIAAAVGRIDGIADASAEIVGTTLKVYVLEAKDHVTTVKAEAYASDYDATVTRVVMRSGTSRVKRGDVVKRGDILADGRVYSTAGELLYTDECDAEVYGEVSVTFDANLSPVRIDRVRTGKSVKKTSLSVFGLTLFKPSSPYESFDTTSSAEKFNVLLPIGVTYTSYYETVPTETKVNAEEAAREFAEEKAREMCFTGDFKSSYTVKKSHSGLYRVHVFLSGEALISRATEFVPEPDEEEPDK